MRRLTSHAAVLVVACVALGVGCTNDDDRNSGSDTTAPTTTTVAPADPNWSMFGRDYANTRAADEATLSAANVARLTPRWSWSGAAVTSTPAVMDGVVYFGDWDGNLVAVDAATGAEVWKTNLQVSQLSPSPFVTEDTVYIAGDAGMVFAVDRASGTKRWGVDIETAPFDRIWSSPIVVDGTLIIGSASFQVFVAATPEFRGSVVGLDAGTGAEQWRASVCDAPCNGVSVWSSAAVDPDRHLAFIGTGQSYSGTAGPLSDSLVAIDYRTGEITWHHQFTAGDAYSVTNPTGPDHDIGAAPNLFEVDGRALVGVGDKGGQYKAFDRETGVAAWETSPVPGSPLGGIEHTTAYADGVIYAVGNTSIAATSRADAVPATATAFALDAADGTVLWQTQLDAGGFGGVSVANGLMLFTTHEGTLHILDTSSGAPLFSTKVGDSSASGPVVSDGVVYVGNGWSWGGGTRGGVVALGT